MNNMTLSTTRLRLREFADHDFAWLHEIASNPEVTRYTEWGPNTPQDTTDFLDDATSAGSGPEIYLWAVTLTDGSGIGSASLHVVSATHRRARFGYMLDPTCWGSGYATEIATELVVFAFDVLSLRRVEATSHPDNAASARVLEKAGLVLEGRMRSHLLARGTWRDSLLWAALDTDPRSHPMPTAMR